MEILHDGDTIHEIRWNNCPRGEQYAISQMGLPNRIMEVPLKVTNGAYQYVRAVTVDPIAEVSKGGLFRQLREVDMKAPLRKGQIVSLLGVRFRILENVTTK